MSEHLHKAIRERLDTVLDNYSDIYKRLVYNLAILGYEVLEGHMEIEHFNIVAASMIASTLDCDREELYLGHKANDLVRIPIPSYHTWFVGKCENAEGQQRLIINSRSDRRLEHDIAIDAIYLDAHKLYCVKED